MRKYPFLILLFFCFIGVLKSEPYKPYPILFVHGINSGSGTWGAEVENREEGDWISADKVDSFSTYYHFLRYMHPYVWMLDTLGYDTTYTIPGGISGWPKDDAYPNKTFLEVINFDDNRGSIDPDPRYPNFDGQGDELWHRINEIMEEYYGEDWQGNRNAKIILVAHSAGGLSVRECIYAHADVLKPHIAKVITLGSPHNGCELAEFAKVNAVFTFIEGVGTIVAALFGQAMWAKAMDISTFFDALINEVGFAVGSASPLANDAVSKSDLLNKLNNESNFQGDGYSWHCLIGRGGYHLDEVGVVTIGVGGGVVAISFWNPWLAGLGGNLIVKGVYLFWFGNYSDGLMLVSDANINISDRRYKAEVKEKFRLSHTIDPFATPFETEQWKTILDFIEEPPSINWTKIFASKLDSISAEGDTFRTDTMVYITAQSPELDTTPDTSGVRTSNPLVDIEAYLVIPSNIAFNSINFTYKGNKSAIVIVRDITGRVVKEYTDVKPEKTLKFGGKEISSGIYFISVKGNEERRKVVLVR